MVESLGLRRKKILSQMYGVVTGCNSRNQIPVNCPYNLMG